jgi:TPP-dependent pyruvate/acetoin dehydrogenase alpha subunit
MEDQLRIETDLFEHREVKPHFINDCCFGEDFAGWLRSKLSDIAPQGFVIGESIQEDYGWGFWIRRGKESFWIALSYVGDGPTEEPAEWCVSVTY